ncbi:NAD(P)-binding oxidoreductase [Amnibacterium setariae]|uniref:NAD(P)-binding oxidoreductase n=1 Tax=Amnibacterium setariae TaxID=2306585 RepID=UPI00131480AA|nr:NAD(P)-binding oxidoreductase [Amnibacterium setariae]
MTGVFLTGVTGKLGRRLSDVLVRDGVEVVGLHREEGQADDLEQRGVTPVRGDLAVMTEAELAHVMRGTTAVAFTAGSDGDDESINAIDRDAPARVARAAQRAGIHRFVLVSVFPEAWVNHELTSSFEHWLRAKREAEIQLAETDLDWVIVRPGALTSESGSHTVHVGGAIRYDEVSRDDVARVLAHLLEHTDIHREIVELTEGHDRIPAALQAYANFVRSRHAL